MTSDRDYDLIAIDLDGTLLDTSHKVPAANREALHRAHESGYRIVVCTGRALPETLPILEQINLDLDAVVTCFGALVTDVRTRQHLHCETFDPHVARDITAWYAARDYTVLWLSDGLAHGFDGYIVGGPRRHLAVDAYAKTTECEMREVDALPDDPVPALRISIIDERDALEPVSDELSKAFPALQTHNVLTAPSWDLTVIETFAPHVNKWFGIHALCEKWEIDPRRTVAVGDDVNDLAMIKHAGLGVAMGNAKDEVKQVADRETKTNREAGVAALIDMLMSPAQTT